MNQVPVLDHLDLPVRGIERDLLQVEKPLLEPHLKKRDDIRIHSAQIEFGTPPHRKEVPPEVEQELQAPWDTGDLLKQIQPGRSGRVPQLLEESIPVGIILFRV